MELIDIGLSPLTLVTVIHPASEEIHSSRPQHVPIVPKGKQFVNWDGFRCLATSIDMTGTFHRTDARGNDTDGCRPGTYSILETFALFVYLFPYNPASLCLLLKLERADIQQTHPTQDEMVFR